MAKLIYSTRRTFDHISRYAPYRTIVNLSKNKSFFESVNSFQCATDSDTVYHVVEQNQEGRLDMIADLYYNNPSYYWVIAWANNLIDPMTVVAGTILLIPSLDSLYSKGGPLEKAW